MKEGSVKLSLVIGLLAFLLIVLVVFAGSRMNVALTSSSTSGSTTVTTSVVQATKMVTHLSNGTPVLDKDGKKIGEIRLSKGQPVWVDTNGFHADELSSNDTYDEFCVYSDVGIHFFADYVVLFKVVDGKIIIISV